jgi:hypothetical protein
VRRPGRLHERVATERSKSRPCSGPLALALALALVVTAGCRGPKPTSVAPPSRSAHAPESGPPLDAFEAKLEVPSAPGAAPPSVPEGALGPFRVWINQETPRQKKTPEWRSFGAKEGLLLDLAADGKWRCLLNPVHLLGRLDDKRTADHWTASRTLRCSSDGWATYVEALVRVGYQRDGKLDEADPRSALYLEDTVGGHRRVTAVVLDYKPEPARR